MLTVCFLDTIGLLFTGDTVYKKGLGGSESATIYMGEELTKLGFKVTVYNKCEQEGFFSGVEYIDLSKIRDEERHFDILISLRSVLPLVSQNFGPHIWEKFHKDIGPFQKIVGNAKYKAVWMHDTFVEGEEFLETHLVDGLINEVFLLSDWHSHYVSQSDHWRTPKRKYEQLKHRIFQTRNGIRRHVGEVDITKKDPNLFVYNSSITKGMIPLVENIWPLVKQKISDAKLVVIGGYYRNAGPGNTADESEKKFFQMKELYDGKLDVHFTGVITQKEIANILTQATWMIYPPDFPETYGISTLEAINYNVIPLTSKFGALEEVAREETSYHIQYSIFHDDKQIERFVNMVVLAYYNPYLKQQKQYACNEIKEWSGWDSVAKQWRQHFYRLFNIMMDRADIEEVLRINSNVNRLYKRRNLNIEDKMEHFNAIEEREIVIISPFYNAGKYLHNCVKSVAIQLYNNYRHILIDDMSTDNSIKIIEKTVSDLKEDRFEDKFLLIKNTTKKNAVWNQVETIEKFITNPEAIVILLDGDDWLFNDPNIFKYINEQYYYGAQMTYGSCHSMVDNIDLISQPYPEDVKQKKSYRTHNFNWGLPYTHLRTFKKELFDKVDKNLLKDENGQYWGAGGDGAVFYGLLEAADPAKIKCIQRILMNYNDMNSLNDYKVNAEEQTKNQRAIQNKFKEPNLIDNLSSIYDGAMARDPKAIDDYKYIITNRTDTWMEDLSSVFINIRVQWILNKLKELNIAKDAKIIDVGSWTGSIANEIYKQGYTNITCFDISKEVVKKGQETFPQFKWICGDIENTKLEEKYDVILMFEIVEHLINPIETLVKGKEFLNENGKIFFTIPTKETIKGPYNFAPEHISILENNQITSLTNNIEILEGEFFRWHVGYIENKTQIKKILIAIPTAKYIESETFASIYNMIKPDNTELYFQFFYGYNIAQVRNLMAHFTIINNFDYIFWVDSDIVIPRDALIKLLNADKDIISGVYIQRKPDQKIPEIYIWENPNKMRNAYLSEVQGNAIQEIAGCGFGCVLTKTQVLKNIGYPQFEYANALDHRNTISEDVDFCMKARRKNYKIFMDSSIKCEHIGNTKFIV